MYKLKAKMTYLQTNWGVRWGTSKAASSTRSVKVCCIRLQDNREAKCEALTWTAFDQKHLVHEGMEERRAAKCGDNCLVCTAFKTCS